MFATIGVVVGQNQSGTVVMGGGADGLAQLIEQARPLTKDI